MHKITFNYTGDLTVKNLTELLTENPAQNNSVYNKLKKHNESNRDNFMKKMQSQIIKKQVLNNINLDDGNLNIQKQLKYETASSEIFHTTLSNHNTNQKKELKVESSTFNSFFNPHFLIN